MKVALLDLKGQFKTIDNEVKQAFDSVLQDQAFILGQRVSQFEEALAKYSNVKYAVGVSSGTDALIASLLSYGITRAPFDNSPAPEVIIPSFTFFATAGSVFRAGAVPVFCDVKKDTFNIDEDKIEELITPRTKAIIPVHLYGQMANMEKIQAIAKKHNLVIIEDACQSIGAKRNGKPTGGYGGASCVSFFPSKNLGGFGDGGAVLTNDEALYTKLIQCRNHGMSPKYYHKWVGGNFRLDAIQAVGLEIKLKHLDSWKNARRKNADFYFEKFKNVSAIVCPKILPENESVYNQFVIQVENRYKVLEALRAKNVGAEIYYPLALHKQECFASLGYAPDAFPVSNELASKVLALPIYPELTEEELNYVAESLIEIVS